MAPKRSTEPAAPSPNARSVYALVPPHAPGEARVSAKPAMTRTLSAQLIVRLMFTAFATLICTRESNARGAVDDTTGVMV